jgi:hypothetical protein
MAHVMSVAHKRQVQVTLDMYVYDDLELPQNDDELEGDEVLSSSVINMHENMF